MPAITIRALTSYLDSIAPPVYQESYDNVGLLVGNPDDEVKGVLICLDSTEAVVEEALAKSCNIVVAHHPIIFKGLKRLTGHNYVERTVLKAIKNDVAIYAIHTNLDNMYYRGVNAKIAEVLGLTGTRLLAPKQVQSNGDNADPAIGAGMIGQLPQPMQEEAFLQYLKKIMKAGCVKHTALRGKSIHSVAVCGGSGAFLLPDAIARQADVFVTSDMKYHEFFDADGKIVIADIGHFESEQFTIELLSEIISEKFANFAVHCAEVITNPVQYL